MKMIAVVHSSELSIKVVPSNLVKLLITTLIQKIVRYTQYRITLIERVQEQSTIVTKLDLLASY